MTPAPGRSEGERSACVGGWWGGRRAAPLCRRRRPPADAAKANIWRFLTGPNFADAEFQKLAATADERTIVERFRPDFSSRLRNAALSISQAGYNTTMDILSLGRSRSGHPLSRQKARRNSGFAREILASKRLLTVVPEAELSPTRLAKARGGCARKADESRRFDLTGAATTARLVHGLATERVR